MPSLPAREAEALQHHATAGTGGTGGAPSSTAAGGHERHGCPPHAPPPRILSRHDPGRYALITLTCINLLNYIDRYIPSATKQYFQKDLDLSDTQTSIPLTAFVFVYMLCSPVFSWLADLGYRRTRIIALGVVIWSVATGLGALATDFWTFLICRSFVGVGEAAYATIAPALLSDFYAPSQRNAVLSIFYLAIPIGAAMGYAIGGEIGGHWGWRVAFLVAGAPGLVVAFMCLAIVEPVLGALDHPAGGAAAAGVGAGAAADNGAVVQAHHHKRRLSQQDLMFGLNEDGMDVELEDDDEAGGTSGSPAAGFAVHSELGGPAPTHPERHANYHPPHLHEGDEGYAEAVAAEAGSESRSILVRSSVPSDRDAAEGGPAPPPSDVHPNGHLKAPPWGASAKMLLRNSTYMYCTIGLALVTFASGGLADWIATWMNRVHHIPESTAATMTGAITCVGGIIGTGMGAFLGEKAKGKIRQPYLGVASLNLIITSLCSWGIMVVPSIYAVGVLVFFAQVSLWSYTGPINATTINSVPPNMRVRAFAFQICFSHAFGDAVSPTIVGAISDATGSIRTAILIIPAAFTLATITWLMGWRLLPEDQHAAQLPKDAAGAPAGGSADGAGRSHALSLSHGPRPQGQSDAGLRDPLLESHTGSGGAGDDDDDELGGDSAAHRASIHLQQLSAPVVQSHLQTDVL